jgi:hypothetical protein
MLKISERREKQRKAHTALHEAGHAVLSIRHGAKIHDVDMEGNSELFAFVKRDCLTQKALKSNHGEAGEKIELPLGENREAVKKAALLDAVILLAGPAMDKLANQKEDQGDIQAATSYVTLAEDCNGTFTKRAEETLQLLYYRTMTEVKANRPSIERVAKLFLSGKRNFSQADIEAVM